MNPSLFPTNRLALATNKEPASFATLPKKEGYLHPPSREGQERLKQIMSQSVVVRGLSPSGCEAEFGFRLKEFTRYFASKVFPAELSLVGSSASYIVQGTAKRRSADYDFRVAPIACNQLEVIHRVVSGFFHPLIAIEGGEVHVAPNGMSISYKLGSIDLNFRSLRDRPVLSVNATDGFEVLLPVGGIRCVDQTEFLDKEKLLRAFVDGANRCYPIHDAERIRYIELRVLDKLTRGYTVSPPSYFSHFLARLRRDYCLSRPCAGWMGNKSFWKDFVKYLDDFAGTEAVFFLNMLAITGVEDRGLIQELQRCLGRLDWSRLCLLSKEHLQQVLLFVQIVLFCERKPAEKEDRVFLGPLAGSLSLLLWRNGSPLSPLELARQFSANMDVISCLSLSDRSFFVCIKQLLAELGVRSWSLTFSQIEQWKGQLIAFFPAPPLATPVEEAKLRLSTTKPVIPEKNAEPFSLSSCKIKTHVRTKMGILTRPFIDAEAAKRAIAVRLPSLLRSDEIRGFSRRWSRALQTKSHSEVWLFDRKAQLLIRSAVKNCLSFFLVTDILQQQLCQLLSMKAWTRRQEDACLQQLFLAHFSSKKHYVENKSWLQILDRRCTFYSRCPDRRVYVFWMACAQRVNRALASWMGLGRWKAGFGAAELSPLQKQAFSLQSMVRNAPFISEQHAYALLPFCHALKGKSVTDARWLLDFGRCWQERHFSVVKTMDERLVFHLAMLQLILHCSQQRRAGMRDTGWRLQTLLPAPLGKWKKEIGPIYLAKFSAQANYLLSKKKEGALHCLFLETLAVVQEGFLPVFTTLVGEVLKVMDQRLQPEVPVTVSDCAYLLVSLRERVSYYLLLHDLLKKRIAPITRFVLQHLAEAEGIVESLFALLDDIPTEWVEQQKMQLMEKVGGWPLLPRYVGLLDTLRGRINKEALKLLLGSSVKNREVVMRTYNKLTYDFALAGLNQQDPNLAIQFMEQIHDLVQRLFQHYIQEFSQKEVPTNSEEIFSRASPVWRLINLFYDRFTTVCSITQIIVRIPSFYYPISQRLQQPASVRDVAQRLIKDPQLKIIQNAMQLRRITKEAEFVKEAARFYHIADQHMNISQGKKTAARMAIEMYKLYCLQVRACTLGNNEMEEAVAPRIYSGSSALIESFQLSQLKEEEQEMMEINRFYWSHLPSEDKFVPISQDITEMRPVVRFIEGKKGFRRKRGGSFSYVVQRATRIRRS